MEQGSQPSTKVQESIEQHKHYMLRAIQLAKKGSGYTSPNPMVGAVIVKNGMIIGQGYHQTYGEAHAEINALRQCKEDAKGATLYVTLEPCSHTGKTPPCAYAIIEAGISKVFVGMEDPNPLVAGRGLALLEEAGIDVICGICEKETKELNRIFIKYITTGRPYLTMKSAMTLDGKVASVTGDSQWITGEESRAYVHKLRHQVSAIMVGVGTVLVDNPRLTTRLPEGDGKNPLRVILDSKARTPINAALIDQEGETLVMVTREAPPDKIRQLRQRGVEVEVMTHAEGINLDEVMTSLGKRGIDSVLLEGGGRVNASALEAGSVDEVMIFIAPKIIGGQGKSPVIGNGIPLMKDAIRLQGLQMEYIGSDILIRGYIQEE